MLHADDPSPGRLPSIPAGGKGRRRVRGSGRTKGLQGRRDSTSCAPRRPSGLIGLPPNASSRCVRRHPVLGTGFPGWSATTGPPLAAIDPPAQRHPVTPIAGTSRPAGPPRRPTIGRGTASHGPHRQAPGGKPRRTRPMTNQGTPPETDAPGRGLRARGPAAAGLPTSGHWPSLRPPSSPGPRYG